MRALMSTAHNIARNRFIAIAIVSIEPQNKMYEWVGFRPSRRYYMSLIKSADK